MSLVITFPLAGHVAAQHQPGDPAHDWLNGKWRGPSPGGGIIVFDTRSGNDARFERTRSGQQLSGSRKAEVVGFEKTTQ